MKTNMLLILFVLVLSACGPTETDMRTISQVSIQTLEAIPTFTKIPTETETPLPTSIITSTSPPVPTATTAPCLNQAPEGILDREAKQVCMLGAYYPCLLSSEVT